MDSNTALRLLDLNQQFYQTFGKEFSATRSRIQPGVKGIMEHLRGPEAILDLGCGNGSLARHLSRKGHPGRYIGLDFSSVLLGETENLPPNFMFLNTDLAGDWQENRWVFSQGFDLVCAFAVLHHIPGDPLRIKILKKIHEVLQPKGQFVHSEWQFFNSSKLRARLQEAETAGFSPLELDPGDYFMDWRRGGHGLRYVHLFNEIELASLAAASGFSILDTFHSDGENGKLGLYQLWGRKG